MLEKLKESSAYFVDLAVNSEVCREVKRDHDMSCVTAKYSSRFVIVLSRNHVLGDQLQGVSEEIRV